MYRKFILLLVLILILTILSPSETFATEESQIQFFINDEPINFEVSPTLKDTTTLVPVRPILEKLGYYVEWNEKNKSVTATKENQFISITVNDTKVKVDNVWIDLGVSPYIKNGRTLVPLDLFEKYLNMTIKTIFKEKAIYISDIKYESENKITILFPDHLIGTDFPATLEYYHDFLESIKDEFETKYNVKLYIKTVSGELYGDFIENRDLLLDKEDGPELIFINIWDTTNDLITADRLLNIKGKIPNIDHLYTALKNDYFIPIGLYTANLTLKEEKLQELNVDIPKFDWTGEDYLSIRDKWLAKSEIRFNNDEYWNLVKLTWNEIDIIDEENNRVDLNNDNIKQYINMLKNDIKTKYLLYDDYTVENYNNMFNNLRSEEFRKGLSVFKEELEKHFTASPYDYRKNLLNPLDSNKIFIKQDIVVLPDIVEYGKVYAWGFVVNKNGKNLDMAYKYLNEMLSDEMQLKIYEAGDSSTGMAPVVKTIEDGLEKMNNDLDISPQAIETRKYIINKLENRDYTLENTKLDNSEMTKIMFIKGIIPIIFADKSFTDDEMSEKLLELESRLNVMLK